MISGNRTLFSDTGVENVDTIKALKLLRQENVFRNYLKEVSTLRRGLGSGEIGVCGNRIMGGIPSGTINNNMGTRGSPSYIRNGTRGSPSCSRDDTFIRK